jgi:uncharacterized protein with HEPN domain
MRPKAPKLLEDIRDAASFIEQCAAAGSLDDYRRDRLVRQAVERNFEIIGEAMRRLTDADPDTAARIDGHSQVIAFRNLLIHGYDLVDDVRVWQVVTQDVPALRRQVEALLREEPFKIQPLQ